MDKLLDNLRKDKLLHDKWIQWYNSVVDTLYISKLPFTHLELEYLKSEFLDEIQRFVDHNINDHLFYTVCKHGCLNIAKWLVKCDNVNPRMDDDVPFQVACEKGHLSLLKWLISEYPDINVRTRKDLPFQLACHFGHLDVLKWLKTIRPDIDHTSRKQGPFRVACMYGRLDVAKWFIEMYPEIQHTFESYNSVFINVCGNGDIQMAEWLLSLFDIDPYIWNNESFYRACRNGHLAMSQWLLYKFPDIGSIGLYKSLIEVVEELKHYDIVEWLKSLKKSMDDSENDMNDSEDDMV